MKLGTNITYKVTYIVRIIKNVQLSANHNFP